MSAVFGSVTVPLKPNRTFGVRSATWEPLPATEVMGVLIVEESVKAGRKVYVSRYLVRKAPFDDRTFEVRKPLEAGGEEGPYWVELGSHWDTCTCKGYESTGNCRHVESLRTLYKTGNLQPGLQPTTSK